MQDLRGHWLCLKEEGQTETIRDMTQNTEFKNDILIDRHLTASTEYNVAPCFLRALVS